MEKPQVPFWEESYKKDEEPAFSAKPNVTLKEFEHLLVPNAKILEVGCGEGQNVMYLAKKGFEKIDAFDLSEHGIAKVKRRCEKDEIRLNAFVADLTNYDFEKKYDLIMSFGTFHFVSKEDWKKFIGKAKENTNAGGIHIMHIFTDKVPITEDLAPFAIGMAKDGEIKELYEDVDWEIMQFKSYVFEDEHPHMPKHFHACNKIVARRVK